MKCPKCRFENAEGIKFCGECGARLHTICPQCHYLNAAGMKFCGECGHDLTAATAGRGVEYARSQSHTPKALADKILASRQSMEGERKQVTVLFADVANFTRISEKMDPEEVHRLVSDCMAILTEEIYHYEGTIAQFMGDGVMALFGAPIAHEDAPQRALYAALGIRERLRAHADKLRKEGIEFSMRIGLNTGLVVVGRIGDDLTMEYTAMGDTVNLASRMESTAQPGTIQVAEATYRLTEGYFDFRPLGRIEVKGKKESVRAYELLGPGRATTRLGISEMRGLTPLVGRDRELDLLLDAFSRAKSGRGQAISIVGEAGVGKSRLLYEFKKTIANEDITFLEGRCLAYSRGEAYRPIVDMLKLNFNVSQDDNAESIREKVKKGLKALGVDETHTLPYLLELLSVGDSGIDAISMSREARKDRIRESLKRIVLKGSEVRPLVMAFEDLQWLDKATEELAKYILDGIPAARVMLIFTYRPDFIQTWGGRSYHNQVTLNRLSNRESLAMVTKILGTEHIDKKLEDLILEKTEGIPFFIEEFIKSLKDLRIIERKDVVYYLARDIANMAIPSTIQDVVMARVDSLPETAKAVLQTGSVIEREFSYELIKRVAGLPEQELLSHLSALRDAELLYEKGIYPQTTYVFKHALTREVVYDSILKNTRKRLHSDVGRAIEEIHKDNLNEHYAILAEHFIAGGDYNKAAEYCRLAAKKAEKTASVSDAITFTQKRVSCLEKLPQAEDVLRRMVDARTTLGLYWSQTNHPDLAREAVEPMVDLALKLDYKRRISQIYSVLGISSWWLDEDYTRTRKYLTDALAMAEELGDLFSLATANSYLGIVFSMTCEWEKASYHFGKALDINTAGNSLWGIAGVKSWRAGWVYDYQGKNDLGYEETSEAVRIAETSGDIYSKAHSHTFHGRSCYCKGLLEDAEESLLAAIDFARRVDDPGAQSASEMWLGVTYLDTDRCIAAREAFERGVSLLEQHKMFPSILNFGRLNLALAKIRCGEADFQLELLQRYQAATRTKWLAGEMLRCLSAILLSADPKRLSEAEDWINRAIEEDHKNGTRFSLAQDFAQYAEICNAKGEPASAKEKLGKAIEILKECGADGWVKKYEEELARL
ncbi:MAG: adenylate/guanylate cyclase domain-containing protein [Dehalococcoidia bacterium]|nr:adenylate/guanylate cyclase domain-containing protein [Dehalococcoidia bacterium]